MKEFKGTKGEWTASKPIGSKGWWQVDSEKVQDIATCYGGNMILPEYDAKLIAAAPDLLNACIEALELTKSFSHPSQDHMRGRLRNAINKALDND